MPNPYLTKKRAEIDAYMQTAERITRQFDVDTFQIALARYEKLDLGFMRIMEITLLAEQVREEYRGAVIKGPEADWYRYHMDQELMEIAKGKAQVIPFESRYPELKKQTYNGRKGE